MAIDPARALDVDSLATWFGDHVGGADDGPLEIELISGGRSNLTFGVRQGHREWVLRRPPLGHVLPSAHDMGREYTVLRALRDTEVPAPRVEAICEDPDVIGASFYVMERVDGRILRTAADARELTERQAQTVSRCLIDVLVRIHAVDWRGVGLERFGHPDGYLDRQIRRWVDQWERSKTRDLPELDALAGWLGASVPRGQRSTLVHGDYRIDNVMLSRTPDMTPIAVLDWELSTLGDPLADLGLLMVYWADEGDAFPPPSVAPQVSPSTGFLSRRALAEAYSAASGLDVSSLPFYVVLGYFKLAIILEGIHRRHSEGRTLGAGFDHIGDEVPNLLAAALEATRTDL